MSIIPEFKKKKVIYLYKGQFLLQLGCLGGSTKVAGAHLF